MTTIIVPVVRRRVRDAREYAKLAEFASVARQAGELIASVQRATRKKSRHWLTVVPTEHGARIQTVETDGATPEHAADC